MGRRRIIGSQRIRLYGVTMRNIYTEPYIETPEQRLRNQMINRKKQNPRSKNPRLNPDQKRKLLTLDPEDRLYFLRNLNPG